MKPNIGSSSWLRFVLLQVGSACLLVSAGGVAPLTLRPDNNRNHDRQDSALFALPWKAPMLFDGSPMTKDKRTDLTLHSSNLRAGPQTWVDLLYPFSFEREFQAEDLAAFCRQWWWVGTLATSLYLVGLWVGTAAMRDRKPYDLKKALAAWNLFLAVFSFIGAVRTVPHLFLMLWTYGFQYTVCRAALVGYGSGATGVWVALFIFSKYFELIDTVFLVVRKRHMGFLHWYHHCSVLLYCWHAYVCEMPTGIYFVSMNYTVHAIMYFYYFLTSVLSQPPKWARLVTVLQLAQMVIGILVTVWHLYTLLHNTTPNCDGHIPNLAGALGMYASYFILFAQFFARRYISAKAKSDKQRLAGAKKVD